METVKITGETSDGYHTFNELYDHRCLIFINLCLCCHINSTWKKDYEGWFCLYLDLPDLGQISYHCPEKYLHLVKDKIKQDQNHKFDGHDSKIVLHRWEKLASGLGNFL